MDTRKEYILQPPASPPPPAKSLASQWPWMVGAILILAASTYVFWPKQPEKAPSSDDQAKIAKRDDKEKPKEETGIPVKNLPVKEPPVTDPNSKNPEVKKPKANDPPPKDDPATDPPVKDTPKKDATTPDVRRPPTTDAPEELHAKDAWGRFAPGSWIKMRMHRTGGVPVPDIELKDTLKSSSESSIEVQRESTDKKEPLEFKYQPDFLIGIDLDRKTWTQAMRSVQFVGDEEVIIAGKKLTTKHVNVEYDFGGKKIYGQFWISADVPGAVTRVITSFDKVRFERELLEFEVKKLIR